MPIEYQGILLTISIITILITSVFIVNKIIPITVYPVKHPEIDGLRGYLAFSVFLHHGYIWYYFLHDGKWKEPESNLFNHFGQTAVVLFFIITAFLFASKLIEAKQKDFDWKKYIVSRFYRLFPIYFFSILIVFLIVSILSNFQIKDSFFNIGKSILAWLFFTITAPIDINNVQDTYLINAGVAWTLPYEWMFYFLLPLFAIFFKVKTNVKAVVSFTILFIIIVTLNKSSLKNFIPFIGGIVCSVVFKKKEKYPFLKDTLFALLAIAFMGISIYFFNSGKKIIPVLCSTFMFATIVAGNSYFGIFSSMFSRKFGQITYSFYLLHGIILFIAFKFLVGYGLGFKLSQTAHWLIVALCIFPVVLCSQLCYKYIELPFMKLKK